MNTVSKTTPSVDAVDKSSAPISHKRQHRITKPAPNLWIPGTESDDYGTGERKPHRNDGSWVSTIHRTRDGMSCVCPCCGHIQPAVIDDRITGEAVRVTYDVWWRVQRTYLRYLSGQCNACHATFDLCQHATIARTAEAEAIEAEEWEALGEAVTGGSSR